MVMLEQLLYSDVVPYAATFLLFFAVLFFVLNRGFFRSNRGVSVVIALCISALIVWGLTNYTNYFDEIVYFIEDLEGSAQLFFFGAGAVVVVLFFYFGMKQYKGKHEFPILWLGLAGLGFLVFFAERIFSIYYLPEFFQEELIRWIFLIAGILVLIVFFLRIKKRDLWSKIKREIRS